MKRILIATAIMCLALPLCAQTPALTTSKKAPKMNNGKERQEMRETRNMEKPYDETINPMEQIDKALDEARMSNRLVICQVGGNWCPWCLKFNAFIRDNKELSELVDKNFVYIHINTSKENKNYEALKRLGNPGRFGYPVLVILDHEGRVMHIQNSSYLEEDKSYNFKKVMAFFQNWTPEAIETIK